MTPSPLLCGGSATAGGIADNGLMPSRVAIELFCLRATAVW